MALHTNRQFCYTCTATRKLLSLALPCRNENFAGKRATVNTTLGTWLAVGDGVGARRAEGAVGVSKKRATMPSPSIGPCDDRGEVGARDVLAALSGRTWDLTGFIKVFKRNTEQPVALNNDKWESERQGM
ncbi:hypothetical protein M441DRAFT_150662 [Trichoderma asperellum CBS 433.97]|uniref:Uncharacterized protein n=1 Tax=Trichoderma asperellum (strain ATCC 204424 / CBS 433.97 / NBRC 101777) TaxID=1042311 RepID=A0A2T3YVI6_TRIA4|nr:hypothetical protein M441DRAFT_150662 [Trichoderma asperellum CBS 433.97]PTB36546.1 hypothetical protein M441DRAFT_150662 [Trichoderma asperellum CBS 433.97]